MVSKYTFDTYIIYIAKVVDAFIALVSEFLASDNKKSEQILDKKNDKESFIKLESKIFKLFHQKYSMSRNFYGRLIINK